MCKFSALAPVNQFKANITGMVLELTAKKFFCVDQIFKMGAVSGIVLTQDPMGKMYLRWPSLVYIS